MFDSIKGLQAALSQVGTLILQSRPKKLRRINILLQCLASGDFNPAHCVPDFAPHSILKGMALHGVGIISRAEAEFQQVLHFTHPSELISLGQETKYRRPLLCGQKYWFRYELSNLREERGLWKFYCVVQCITQSSEKPIAEWLWHGAYVEHQVELEQMLQPKSYAVNVIKYFVLQPLKTATATAILTTALIAIMWCNSWTNQQLVSEFCKNPNELCLVGAAPL